VKERSGVAIMGFNSPEWVLSFIGGTMANCVTTGVYTTNAPDACIYQADHSESEVIVCETNEMAKRYDLSKLPRVKAVVIWGEKALPAEIKDNRFFLWNDFLKLGADIKDQVVNERAFR
jgi:long-chain-fatty-acid--CoA ligase ACSBG